MNRLSVVSRTLIDTFQNLDAFASMITEDDFVDHPKLQKLLDIMIEECGKVSITRGYASRSPLEVYRVPAFVF